VEIFAQFLLQHLDRLDIIIHNAAQTVRRPPGFYAHLMKDELTQLSDLSVAHQHLLKNYEDCKTSLAQFNLQRKTQEALQHSENDQSIKLDALVTPATTINPLGSSSGIAPGIGITSSAQLSQIPYSIEGSYNTDKIFPKNKLDADLQQVDLRETNSWRYKIDDVPTPELLEVQLVNAVAPFVLTSKLLPLMKKDVTGEKHIVNVTAMEGKFHRFTKIERHPHTNMAKAALNMLTHTAAGDLAKFGIYMNAVDTGWVTDENPAQMLEKVQSIHDFQPPLDIVDGAARICDPFYHGILTGHHWCGKFLKDYQPIDW
jgi:NAD(P)-dependent dehydrogenase (short-subunit alcohol dehydrogenase family)